MYGSMMSLSLCARKRKANGILSTRFATLTPAAPVAANSPGRPQWLMAKPNVIGTGSRLSGITEGIIRYDPVAMASAAGGIVGL